MDTSLASFGAGEAEPTGGLVGVANAAYLTEPPERENIKGWEPASTEYGLRTHRVESKYSGGDSHSAATHEVRWVSGGDLKKYVERYGDTLRSIPETYSGFSGGSFDPYVGCVDGLIEDDYAYGISGTSVERALRILNDNGRYQASKYHIITAGEHPWILTGPKGVVLCSLTPVERTDRNAQTSPVEFAETTIDVEEDNPIVVRALKRVEAYLAGEAPVGASSNDIHSTDRMPLTFAIHEDVPTSTKLGGTDEHVFNTEDGDGGVTISIAREDLEDLGKMAVSPNALPGVPAEEAVTSPSGTEVTVDYTPEQSIGEFCEDGLVVGYSFEWQTFEYSPEEVATLTTYYLELPDGDVDALFSPSISRSQTKVTTTSPHY